MKTICILCQRKPNPRCGGIERVSYTLASELVPYGFSAFFVCSTETNDFTDFVINNAFQLPGATIDSDDNVHYLSMLLDKFECNIILNQAANNFGFVNLCSKVIEKRRSVGLISAIHFAPHQEWISLKCNRFLSKGNDQKSIMFMLKKFINDLIIFTKRHKIQNNEITLLQRICRDSKKVVVLSDSYVEEFSRMVHASNIVAIPNLIESRNVSISLDKKEKTVLYVGRLEYGLKRVDRLLHIWREIEKSFPEWYLKIVGDGDYRYILEYVSKQLGLQRVSFEGSHSPEDYYRKASIICLTSSSEGFGMVLVEAMQYGCVPVAYNSYAALSDIVEDGVNGFAVTPFKQAGFVEKLTTLMRDEEMRNGMGKMALLVPPKFDSRVIVQKWVTLFDSLVKASD